MKRRLLAIRIAGASFQSLYNIRPPTLGPILGEWISLRRRLSQVRSRLVNRIYCKVPQEPDRFLRKDLIQLKRDVYNNRQLLPRVFPLPADLEGEFSEYSELMSCEEFLLREARSLVIGEIREKIAQLLEDTDFTLAYQYSSSDLAEAIEYGCEKSDDFMPYERGIYAYATRFFSKANPFHLFAKLAFPPAIGIHPGGAYEIVIDTAFAMEIERTLLAGEVDPQRLRVHLCPWTFYDGSFKFWVSDGDGFQIVSVHDHGLVRKLVAFFSERQRSSGAPTATFCECREYIARDLIGQASEKVEELLSKLIGRGIIKKYIITDFRSFPADLLGLSPLLDPLLSNLKRFHLALVQPDEIAHVHGKLRELQLNVSESPEVRFYVNSYDLSDTKEHEQAAAEVLDDLRNLKLFFGIDHNFARRSRILRFYTFEYLRATSARSAPYLDVLRYMLNNISRISESLNTSGPDNYTNTLQTKLSSLTGCITSYNLAFYKELIPAGQAFRSICFNGPFDYINRRFYVANIFDGQGHFSSRYLLQRRRATPELEFDTKCMHVELAVSPVPSLNFVVNSLDVGVGFDARYSHGFQRWIEPAKILLETEGEEIIYRHSDSGALLKVHYFGFLLTQYLPIAHQLLLINHADSFSNPFQSIKIAPMIGELSYDPGLFYGAVCLRRPSWTVAAEHLLYILKGVEILRCTALLREWFIDRLGSSENLWYYRTVGSSVKHSKPNLLDVLNPLSVLTLRRALLTEDCMSVMLSVMEPSLEHLYKEGGAPIFTELMIEV